MIKSYVEMWADFGCPLRHWTSAVALVKGHKGLASLDEGNDFWVPQRHTNSSEQGLGCGMMLFKIMLQNNAPKAWSCPIPMAQGQHGGHRAPQPHLPGWYPRGASISLLYQAGWEFGLRQGRREMQDSTCPWSCLYPWLCFRSSPRSRGPACGCWALASHPGPSALQAQ